MRRFATLLVAGVLALAAPTAEASPPQGAAEQFRKALADIDALAKQTRANGEMPRLAVPRVSEAFARLFDDKAILGSPPYSNADMPVLLEVLENANAVSKAYLFFAPGQGVAPDSARNAAVYQDEITVAQAFLLKTIAAIMPATAGFVGSLKSEDLNEARVQGARQLRAGLLGIVTGSVMMLRSPAYRADNQDALATALADAGDEIGAGLPEPDRRAVASAAETALGEAAPAARPKLEAFIAAVKAAPCDALCAVK